MRPDAENEIDAALKAQGLRRHVALTLPHWSASTEVLAGTDLILTVASRALANVASGKALRQFCRPSTCRHSHSSRHGTAGAIPIQRFAG